MSFSMQLCGCTVHTVVGESNPRQDSILNKSVLKACSSKHLPPLSSQPCPSGWRNILLLWKSEALRIHLSECISRWQVSVQWCVTKGDVKENWEGRDWQLMLTESWNLTAKRDGKRGGWKMERKSTGADKEVYFIKKLLIYLVEESAMVVIQSETLCRFLCWVWEVHRILLYPYSHTTMDGF